MALPLAYLNEYRYTVAPSLARELLPVAYGGGGPTSDFENSVQASLAQANQHFQHEEFSLALNTYRQVSNLILSVANPQLPVGTILDSEFLATRDSSVLATIVAASARTLTASAATRALAPSVLFARSAAGANQVAAPLANASVEGLVRSPVVSIVDAELRQASDAATREDWTTAQAHYSAALDAIPSEAVEAVGRVTHDLAIATEKAGDPQKARDLASRAPKMFARANNSALQAKALETLAGIDARAGNGDLLLKSLSQSDELRRSRAITEVTLQSSALAPPSVRLTNSPTFAASLSTASVSATQVIGSPSLSANLPKDTNGQRSNDPNLLIAAVASSSQQLLSGELNLDQLAPATLAIRDQAGVLQTIAVDRNIEPNLNGLLTSISTTRDVTFLTAWWRNPHVLIAYLPHVYFFVIPLAIGDCLTELGQYDQAEASYLSTLAYPFINKTVEIVSLWTKLANLYLLEGDAAYRAAANDPLQFPLAQAKYERIVKTDNTLDPASPLYQNAQFASMKTRVAAFLALPAGTASTDNPAIILPVLRSVQKLGQMAAGLNFFGFPPDYSPPFSFEYLQSQAQYLATQAARMDESYINFKSTAENEQFRQEQFDQQVAIGDATVELQRRNLAEAQAEVAVSQASLQYATQQEKNADDALAAFINTFRDLIDIAGTQAAMGASTLPEFQGRPASEVASELAGTQAMISSELEGQRLLQEFVAAGKYKKVAQAQVNQAQQRVAVAQQSVAIAQLQQRYAIENRDFLDRREFSAGLWYDLAKFIKGISHRYLDMAIETAFLMQRAYALETGRDLARIRFDYLTLGPQSLLGGALLSADIDSFTLDYLTSTRSKKAPVKIVLSLANQFPMAMFNLRRSGSCVFETTLEHLDRAFAGMYLSKIRNVAVNFIGIFAPGGIVGTLRNIGVSNFRNAAGDVVQLVYPADILPLSSFDAREDALFYRFKPNELRIFENNGVATAWQLDLPLGANDIDFESLVDVQISLFYDAFFSTDLETQIRAALPVSGSANSAFSMSLFFPDELFFLKNQGKAVIRFDRSLFPATQVNMKTTRVRIRAGAADPVPGLRLHVAPKALGADMDITTDAQGLADSQTAASPLLPLVGQVPFDQWTITIQPADNPTLVKAGKLDLSSLPDIQIFIEYDFDFRK